MKTKKHYSSTINIPDNVDIKKIENIFYFQGPLGKTALNLKKIDPKGLAGVLIDTFDKKLKIRTTSKAFYGLLKSIIQNKLQGISRGFLIYLKIVGIGYRANLIQNNSLSQQNKNVFDIIDEVKKKQVKKDENLDSSFFLQSQIKSVIQRKIETNLETQTLFLKLGYSHDIIYKIPSSVRVFLLDPTLLCLFGVDKNQITQIAAQIRQLRRPTVYKGKGIRLLNEKIMLKVGKRK
jgi:large subunit ribosomal protein L6